MPDVSLYVRFSPRPDEETSESNATQIDLCTRYCQERGYQLTPERIFEDRAISGADPERPGLWAAVASLKRGDVLVAYSWDRLARDVYLSELIRRDVERKGARIEVVSGHNGKSDTDVAIQQILAVFDALDRKTKSARTAAAMKAHQSRGRAMGSVPPYGWCRGFDEDVVDHRGVKKKQRRWVVDPDEEVIRQYVVEQYAAGRNPNEIAAQLNANSIPCRGKQWYRATVERIVRRNGTGGCVTLGGISRRG